jgi:hypothetical protein
MAQRLGDNIVMSRQQSSKDSSWNGYNNAGIAAVAIGCTLNHLPVISLAKALTIMPIVMHESTLKFLANSNTRSREIASLISLRPDFAHNFSDRYHSSLVHSINAIQILVNLGYISFDGRVSKVKNFIIDDDFGKRAYRINNASGEIASLLASSEEEIYLNLRIAL